MKKEEIIEKYGIEWYNEQLEKRRERYKLNSEKEKEYGRKYREEYPEKTKETKRKWRENNIEYDKERNRKWRENNIEYDKERNRKWREEHPEYQQEYKQIPIGRAVTLVNNYKRNDKEYNRGECTLTSKWILEHIFNSQCLYCGETDWQKLGCDRIDNNLPHTPDNVVCACWDCNRERKTRPFEEFLEYKMKKG